MQAAPTAVGVISLTLLRWTDGPLTLAIWFPTRLGLVFQLFLDISICFIMGYRKVKVL